MVSGIVFLIAIALFEAMLDKRLPTWKTWERMALALPAAAVLALALGLRL